MKYSMTTFAYLNVFMVSITKVHIYIYIYIERERERVPRRCSTPASPTLHESRFKLSRLVSPAHQDARYINTGHLASQTQKIFSSGFYFLNHCFNELSHDDALIAEHHF
jgi:hypothetical protein